ncbi:MAG: insulinase family protein [Acidimicrobiia bacterium]|nr:insulinase family protein [Acidimicrobiia bacterium]MDH4308863.1 insulinase family protein [Acidimicrobiia bacterium]MDH5293795.1 insulinase family protein [Acidimicrobiia bacterium]
MHYDLTTLPSGLRVITEHVPGIRSVSVGCWIDTGTRDENPNEAGASHFLEHLLFKGSESLSAREISETFDAMGAESNAFTSKDHTCFWARLLDTDLPRGMEVLGEMLQRPAFREREIEAEREVVIEEINESEDDPSDLAFEEFTRTVFEEHPLALPVLGTRESIRGMTRDDIFGYWKRRYGAGSVVVAMAGAMAHQEAVDLVADTFGSWSGEPVDHEHVEPSAGSRVAVRHRDTEQAHLVIGGLGFERGDRRRWAFEVLNLVLGGGMASRLFTKIREERGLVYSVYSFRSSYADAGAWGVYAGTTPRKVGQVLDLVVEELAALVAEGITPAELARAKGSVRGGLALAMEDANSRMVRLGRDEMVGAPHLSIDERIDRIDAVTLDDVRAVAAEFLTRPRVIGAVGPFEAADLERYTS